MKPADAARLLALIQAFDRRTVGEIDIQAWADALTGLEPEDCAEGIRDHFRRTDSWLMPAHVRDYCDRKRRDQAERRHAARLHEEYMAGKSQATPLMIVSAGTQPPASPTS